MTFKRDSFLVFGSPRIGEAEVEEVVKTVRSGWLGTGPKCRQFEQDMRAYVGDWGHPVALNSCTAALHLALVTAGIGPGDEVITTAMTFCATVNTVIHAGGTPVLADCDPATMNIDPEAIRSRITPKTKALLPVHFAGRPCDMDAMKAVCDEHNLVLIEDCAHAIESTWRGQKTGTFGDFGCYSFYVTKNVITGEGGMAICRTAKDAERLRTLSLHGMSRDAYKRFSASGYKHYAVVEAGFKYNMMDLQAAIGIHQLARVEENWLRRQEIWRMYNEAFADLPLRLPAPVPAHVRHAFHLYTVLVDEGRCGLSRDAFLEAMKDRNVGCGVHYQAIPEHPYYRERFGWSLADTPNAVRIGRQTVSIPLSAKLTDQDVEDVIAAVKDVLGG